MYITLNLAIDEKETVKLEEHIKQEVPKAIEEFLLKDKNELNNMIRKCVKNVMAQEINNLMQGKDFRDYLRDKIYVQLGMKQ